MRTLLVSAVLVVVGCSGTPTSSCDGGACGGGGATGGGGGGTGGGTVTGGGTGTGGGTPTGGGNVTGGGTATGGGAPTGGGSVTGGGAATGGGSAATGGGSMTATGGGSAATGGGSTSGGTLLFSDGWETRTELGCDPNGLLDKDQFTSHTTTAWDDYGGSDTCTTTPVEAEIVNTMSHDGTRSLRVAQRTGEQNGTDFRILNTFGSQAELTVIVWMRWDSSYRWATADHKNVIILDSNATAQNMYLNLRGQAGDPLHARWALSSTPVDAVFTDTSQLVTVDTWYRIRLHLKSGTHGLIEMWLMPEGQPEVKLNLTFEAGTAADPNDLDMGDLATVKLDTTYNDGAFITGIWYRWFDSVAVYQGLYP